MNIALRPMIATAPLVLAGSPALERNSAQDVAPWYELGFPRRAMMLLLLEL